MLLTPCLLIAQPIKHFKNEDGLAVPTPKASNSSDYGAQQKIIDEAVAGFYRDLEEMAKSATKPELPEGKELFPCTKSKSFSDTVMKGANLDILLVEKGRIPPEPEVTLGEKVIIMPYSHTDYSFAHTFVDKFDVTCLPTRIRIIDGKVTKLEGDRAYLSFKASEKGEEHQFIKNWRKSK